MVSWGRRSEPVAVPASTDTFSESAEAAREVHLAVVIGTIVVLLVIALAIGQFLSARRVHWLPACGATILVGAAAGYGILQFDLYQNEQSWFHPIFFEDRSLPSRILYLDPSFFNLLILPPLIFESGYALDSTLLSRNLARALLLGVLGTLFAAAATWLTLDQLGRQGITTALQSQEAAQFASLLTAVDPVVLLPALASLGVDPMLGGAVRAEAAINNAVAFAAFRACTHLGVQLGREVYSFALSFAIVAGASALVGAALGAVSALCLRGLGLGRHGEAPAVECTVFAVLAYAAFVCAEAPGNSGVVSALAAALVMRRYATPNLSPVGRAYVEMCLRVASALSTYVLYLVIGLALPIELPWSAPLPSARLFGCALGVCVIARALHAFPLLALSNVCASRKMAAAEQAVLAFSGQRGAVAVALACQVGGPHAALIRGTTLLLVAFSAFAFGGSAKGVVDACGVGTSEEAETSALAPEAAQNKAFAHIPPTSAVGQCLEACLVDRRPDEFDVLCLWDGKVLHSGEIPI